MPLKYSIYKLICIINLVLISVLILAGIFYMFSESSPSNDDYLFFFLFLFIGFIYFMNSYWGLSLIRKFNQEEYLSDARRRWILIVFFLQAILQIILIVQIAFNFHAFIVGMMHRLNPGLLRNPLAVFQFFPSLIFLLTIYYEVFTLNLINRLRNNYKILADKIAEIGSQSEEHV